MAITHVKVTYSVQPITAHRVQELATKWSVPKSEVIRRAVESASRQEAVAPRMTPLQALEYFRSKPPRDPAEMEREMREIRLSRRASGQKRGAQQDKLWKKYEKNLAARLKKTRGLT